MGSCTPGLVVEVLQLRVRLLLLQLPIVIHVEGDESKAQKAQRLMPIMRRQAVQPAAHRPQDGKGQPELRKAARKAT